LFIFNSYSYIFNLLIKYIIIFNNYFIINLSFNFYNFDLSVYFICLNLPILINPKGNITPNTIIEQRLTGALLGDA